MYLTLSNQGSIVRVSNDSVKVYDSFIHYPSNFPPVKVTYSVSNSRPVKDSIGTKYLTREGEETYEPFEVQPYTGQKVRGGFRVKNGNIFEYHIPNSPVLETYNKVKSVKVTSDLSREDLKYIQSSDVTSQKYKYVLAEEAVNGFNEVEGFETFNQESAFVDLFRVKRTSTSIMLDQKNFTDDQGNTTSLDDSRVVFDIVSSPDNMNSFMLKGLFTGSTMGTPAIPITEYSTNAGVSWTSFDLNTQVNLAGPESTIRIRVSNSFDDSRVFIHWMAVLKEVV